MEGEPTVGVSHLKLQQPLDKFPPLGHGLEMAPKSRRAEAFV